LGVGTLAPIPAPTSPMAPRAVIRLMVNLLFEPDEASGDHKISEERPLKLNFAVSAERLERLHAEKAWHKVKEADREALLAILRGMLDAGEAWTDRPAFEAALNRAAVAGGGGRGLHPRARDRDRAEAR